ncbi:hypothetical protein HD806DRAFT_550776 [Xylariaceae sp. AK1471]|nr:hypothetical protein HD806DRAFT_550776 [Xylariaceae sp. AK1471]
MSDTNLANLVETLGLGHLRSKSKARLQALLLEIFTVSYNMRFKYNAKEESRDNCQEFFREVTNEVKVTGIKGGDFLYYKKRETSSDPATFPTPGNLAALSPDTVMALVTVHMTARNKYLQMHQDQTQQRLVLRHMEDTAMKAGMYEEEEAHGTSIRKSDDATITEDYEQETLFAPEDPDSANQVMSKKDKRLVSLVDNWMTWIEQEKGNKIDPMLMKGLNM